MKITQKIIIIIGIIIAIPLILALFTKKDFDIERSININQSKSDVFSYIKYLKNQSNYSIWSQADPNMKVSHRGTDGTIGFVARWESKNEEVGVGEQEIKKIVEGERINYELRFEEPYKSVSRAYMITEELPDGQTVVRWGFNGHMDYPSNLMLLFMDMQKEVGDDLQKGLVQLKEILEAQPMSPLSIPK